LLSFHPSAGNRFTIKTPDRTNVIMLENLKIHDWQVKKMKYVHIILKNDNILKMKDIESKINAWLSDDMKTVIVTDKKTSSGTISTMWCSLHPKCVVSRYGSDIILSDITADQIFKSSARYDLLIHLVEIQKQPNNAYVLVARIFKIRIHPSADEEWPGFDDDDDLLQKIMEDREKSDKTYVVDSLCCICIDETPTIKFKPCGHLCICATCNESYKGLNCVVCNTPFDSKCTA
jgi:hypothetical protein